MSLFDRLLKPFSVDAQLRDRQGKKARKLREAQALILRYPKSGVTWLRVMLSHVYQSRQGMTEIELIGSTRFETMVPGAPRVFVAGPNDPWLADDLERSIGQKKSVLLIRDPRDVAVSLFFHMTRRATPLERRLYFVPDDVEERGLFSFVMNPKCG